MKMRKKTIIIIVVTTISMISILYAASQMILFNSFAKLEEQNTRQNVERVLSALSNEFSELNSKTGDWAEWDDTYTFIKDLNNDYIQANLVDASFINLRINLILFVNNSGQVVAGMAFDLQNMTETSLPQSFLELLSTNDLIWRHPDTNSSVTGIVLLPEDPLMLASRPILTSQREGPIRGALIFGRYFNNEEVNRLAQTVHLPLILHRVGDSHMPSDFQAASSSLSKEAPIFVQTLNTYSIAGYALINDIYGNPVLVLRADMPRDIYKQGQATITYFVSSLFAVCLVFGATTMLLLEKTVLSPLTQLTSDVSSIGKRKDLSARVSMVGNDELSTLAESINIMLTQIENKTIQLQKSERFATIGELATMVGHDLRNPLQGISNATFYLKKKIGPKMNDKQREILELIEQDVKYSDKIVNDLLDYSREMQLELTETTPKSIIREALSMVEVPKNIQVLDATQSERTIKVDVDKMKRAFVNIIKNAIEAMSEGGTLSITSKKSNGNIAFIFSDTGVGMSKETLDKLFTPLFTTKAKGMGFGLAICKHFIEAHGGKIFLKSTLGKGTTITLTIPIEPKLEGGEKLWENVPKSLLLTTTKA